MRVISADGAATPDAGVAMLVRSAQAGDRTAFDAIYAQCVGRVYAVCLRMSGDRASVEQLTQDAFVRAWQNLGSFRGDCAFTSWLHRVTVNVVLEAGRSSSRREARVRIVDDPSAHESPGQGPWHDERIDLERAIARLPKGARTVLVLFDVEGHSQEEIARMTGTAVGTVKAQLHRARRLLREMLQ